MNSNMRVACDTFSLSNAQATLTYPRDMTEDDFAFFREWLTLRMRHLERRIFTAPKNITHAYELEME